MKKRILPLIALCLMSYSSVQAKSFWVKLDGQHLADQDAQQRIGSWVMLPAETTFALQKDYTDQLGFRHQVFQQYVAGVQVEGGIVRVHSRGGVLTSANGYVVERGQLPQRVRRMKHDGALTDDGRTLVLVEMSDGAHYAYKHYDRFGNADVLTDAETGTELKRLSRLQAADMKTTGLSRYSGEVEFTINPTTDGRYALTDSARHIFTIDARGASPDTTPYAFSEEEWGYDLKQYFHANTRPLYNTDPHWSLLRVDSIIIDSLSSTVYEWSMNADFLYTDIYGEKEKHGFWKGYDTPSGFRFNFTRAYYEANVPFTVNLQWFDDTEGDADYLVDCVYTEPGVHPLRVYDADGVCRAKGNVYVDYAPHIAVDVHWGIEQTYDFYNEVFHRDSYDNQGAPIYSVLYPLYTLFVPQKPTLTCPEEYAATQMTPSLCYMVYGWGKTRYDVMASIDDIAHEFTHMVTYHTSSLEYFGESGALNESFSDIIGITVKQKVKNLPGNWVHSEGEAVDPQVKGLRDMENPESMGNPGIYQGEYWVNPSSSEDYGGVHINSGVQNHWYYYLVSGGEYTDRQGINHSFAGIGLDRAVQIAYRNFTELLTPTAQYRDAVLGSLQAAEDLYGADSPERQAVVDAWAAVGLLSDGTSGIAATPVTTAPAADNVIYRLDGTRVGVGTTQGLAPGIYVKNGMKIAL